MQKFRLFCGIDVSKASLSVAILRACGEIIERKTYSNDAAGIEQLYQRLLRLESDLSQILVCLEHTGVYGEKLTMAFADTPLFVWVVNALMVKYARVSFERLKTDPKDALKIAQFAHMMQAQAQPYQPLNAQETQIRNLYRLRGQLVKLRQQVKNCAATNLDKAIPCPISSSLLTELIERISQMVQTVEAELQRLCQQDPRIKRTHQILRSIPGIGPVCAWQLIFTTQHFRRFTSHKQYAAYAGTAPYEHQSGSSLKRKPRLSKKAARQIKTNLTMGAIRQIRPNMVFHQYYHHMKEVHHKHHLWIINSIRNMMLKLAFDLVKKDQLFDLEQFLINKKSWQKFLTLS
ncbi:MAG: IS110 family transposase [Bacteroidota bacterium]